MTQNAKKYLKNAFSYQTWTNTKLFCLASIAKSKNAKKAKLFDEEEQYLILQLTRSQDSVLVLHTAVAAG